MEDVIQRPPWREFSEDGESEGALIQTTSSLYIESKDQMAKCLALYGNVSWWIFLTLVAEATRCHLFCTVIVSMLAHLQYN